MEPERMKELSGPETFRSYVYFWFGQLVSLFGSSVSQFVIIWWITLETGSALFLSLAAFLGLAPSVILSPFAGVFVDRWNRRVLIAVADLLQALATVVLIGLFWFGFASIWWVLTVLTFRGVMQAFHYPAVSAITPLMVPKERLSRMNGLNYLLSGAVNMVGPVVAAVLLAIWRVQEILWIDALTFMVAIVPLLLIVIPSVRGDRVKSSFRSDFSEGFGFIRGAKGFLTVMVVATALNFLLTPLSTLLPYFVKFDHLGGAPDLALVMVFFQGGILAGGLLMSIVSGFKKKMVAVTVSIYVVFLGYVLFALTPTGLFWFMAVAAVVLAFCLPIANVLLQTIMQVVVPLEMQGRVNSVSSGLSMAATPVGMIVSGVAVVFVDTAYLFLACAIAGVAVLTVSWFFTDFRHVEKIQEANAVMTDAQALGLRKG